MGELPVLPEHLWKIRDEVIYSAHHQIPIPSDISEIVNWLEVEGWDCLTGFRADYEFAINLQYFSQFNFDDDELVEYDIIKSKGEATDAIRLEFARKRLESVMNGSDDNVVSLHPYELVNEDGEKALLGFMIEIQGQGGPVLSLDGVFLTKEQFFDHEKSQNVWRFSDIKDIADEELLAFWR